MDTQDIRTFKILEEIDQDDSISQRNLAKQLNISLGLVNSFIKRLANKGYFKITTMPKNRFRYILTPKGIREKTRLTYEYVKLSYQIFNDTRQKLQELYQKLEAEECQHLVFYGAGDLAELAYILSQDFAVAVVAVVDHRYKGKAFFNNTILDPEEIKFLSFDKILITTTESVEAVYDSILEKGISRNQVVVLQ